MDPRKQDGVVYKILCECGKVYIGETGRCMHERIEEHNRDIWLSRTQTSEHTYKTVHYSKLSLLTQTLTGTLTELKRLFT